MTRRISAFWRALLLVLLRGRGAVARRAVARRHPAELHQPPVVQLPARRSGRHSGTPTSSPTPHGWLHCRRACGSVSSVAVVATVCGTAAAVALSHTRFFGQQGIRALSAVAHGRSGHRGRDRALCGVPAAQPTWHDAGIRCRTQRPGATVRHHPGHARACKGSTDGSRTRRRYAAPGGGTSSAPSPCR